MKRPEPRTPAAARSSSRRACWHCAARAVRAQCAIHATEGNLLGGSTDVTRVQGTDEAVLVGLRAQRPRFCLRAGATAYGEGPAAPGWNIATA
jgi:hypothetical protein